jgi:hypothetical protein
VRPSLRSAGLVHDRLRRQPIVCEAKLIDRRGSELPDTVMHAAWSLHIPRSDLIADGRHVDDLDLLPNIAGETFMTGADQPYSPLVGLLTLSGWAAAT